MHSRSSRIILETSLSQKPRETMSTMVVRAVRHLEMQISELVILEVIARYSKIRICFALNFRTLACFDPIKVGSGPHVLQEDCSILANMTSPL